MNSSPSQHALRVFLVEDALAIRARMAARLGAIEGVEIVGEAEEPEAALAAIGASAADVVVLDLRLAGGTGLELLQHLAQRNSPVVAMVLTNHSGAWFRQACLTNGARYFFDKTSEFDLACHTIKRLAHAHSARDLYHLGAHHV
ncbi:MULTISPECIES: response regulator [Paraburkholderia]|uniref:DNA-binding NarL/FixJ family response regulator n=2 Tax=Paraburkholderia TaxID=1822464 RepID=A0A7Y9W9X7_9BURK|nr:response regulator [Paraburkholderia bryophila]NYH16934.1 DNA-binding NarL/FixJ family response regulator [Paraburkholderia bryophila]NYH27760.1 DNA-binding NarL/FixJ family response regulator [Paraburkholderia bryophila]